MLKNKKYHINFNSQRRERLRNINECVSHRIFNSVNFDVFSVVWRTTLPVYKGVIDKLKNNLGEKPFNELYNEEYKV